MNLAADMGRHSGRATPSLHDAPYRQFDDETGRRSTYPRSNPVQTNPATSARPMLELPPAFRICANLIGYESKINIRPDCRVMALVYLQM